MRFRLLYALLFLGLFGLTACGVNVDLSDTPPMPPATATPVPQPTLVPDRASNPTPTAQIVPVLAVATVTPDVPTTVISSDPTATFQGQTRKMTVAISNIRYAQKTGKYDEARAGYRYILMDIQFTNTSGDPFFVSDMDFSLVTREGLVYQGDSSATYSQSQHLPTQDIAAGKSVSGTEVFQIGQDETPVEVVMSSIEGGVVIRLTHP